MNEFRRTTIRLTIVYSVIFISAMALFSGGLYLWTDHSLGEGYVDQVSSKLEQNDRAESRDKRVHEAEIAADVALDRFRNIIIIVNGLATIIIPLGAYQLTKRTLRPLVESQERQKQFVSNASHELRTPLAVLSGELELAMKHTQTITAYKQTISASKEEVDRMVRLVQQLLLMTRLDENAHTLTDKETVDINELVVNVMGQHHVKAAARDIVISYRPADNPLTVEGSSMLLSVAVANVLDNAIKYSAVKTQVIISVSQAGEHVAIAVEDNGPGISMRKQPHIFDRFYQADASRHNEGFGLGLAIMKRIIDIHKGEISFKSVEGHGTTVTLKLPVG